MDTRANLPVYFRGARGKLHNHRENPYQAAGNDNYSYTKLVGNRMYTAVRTSQDNALRRAITAVPIIGAIQVSEHQAAPGALAVLGASLPATPGDPGPC